MRTAIFEASGEGHRLSYVRALAWDNADQESTVLFLPRGVEASPQLNPLPSNAVIEARDDIIDLRTKLHRLNKLADDHQVDLIVVPDGDLLASRIALQWWTQPIASMRLLIMREPGLDAQKSRGRRIKAWIKRGLLWLASRRSRVEVFVLRSAGDDRDSPHPTVTDPVSWRPDIDAAIRLAPQLDGSAIFDALVVGAITDRKSVDIVAEAMTYVTESGQSARLIVAGRQSTTATAALRRARDLARSSALDFVEVDRELSDGELDGLMALSDCVVLAHTNEGPSGILNKAAAGSIRVVCAGAQSLKADLSRVFESGGVWVPLDARSLADALLRVSRGEIGVVSTHQTESRPFSSLVHRAS